MELTERELYLKTLSNYLRNSGSKSMDTWKVYSSTLNVILNKFPEPKKATLFEIQSYAAAIKNDNTRRNTCVMLRWLFNKVLGWDIKWFELPYPKRKKKVQPIYTAEETMKMLNAIVNAKHKAIVALMIDSGLRISEPCSISLVDCDSKNESIILRSAKGDNDRTIYPSKFVWECIRIYWKEWNPKPLKYLFEGQTPGHPYTETSIREIIKMACNKANIQYKKVHAIRRYMITWSAENDVPLSVIAAKSGHASTKTIEKHYLIHSPTYLKKVKSPLGNL